MGTKTAFFFPLQVREKNITSWLGTCEEIIKKQSLILNKDSIKRTWATEYFASVVLTDFCGL